MKISMILAAGAAVGVLGFCSAASADSWEGNYWGASADYAFGTGKFSGKSGLPTNTLTGGGAAVTLGHNWQSGDTVYSVEGDAGYQSAQGSKTSFGTTFKTQTSFVGDLRGRIGHLSGPWLVYVIGGASVGTGKATINTSSQTKTVWGGNAGVGFEKAMTGGLSFRGEYSFTGFAKAKSPYGTNDAVNLNRVSVGFSKKF